MASSLKSAATSPKPTDTGSPGTRSWTVADTWDSTGSATCAMTGNSLGHFLKIANGFGFTIPAGAIINGIIVEFKVNTAGTNAIYDSEVVLVKAGTLQATSRASLTSWKDADWLSHGSSTDLWGGTWTPDDINSATFGSAVSPKNLDTNAWDAVLNGCRITVYYTPTSIKTIDGLAKASIKTINGLSMSSVKSFNGLN